MAQCARQGKRKPPRSPRPRSPRPPPPPCPQESARFGRRLEELFGEAPPEAPHDPDEAWELALRTRVGLFAPGGPLAQQFARNSTVLIVNDTVFAHGGVLPVHVKFGLERINEGVSRWMLGESTAEVQARTRGADTQNLWDVT